LPSSSVADAWVEHPPASTVTDAVVRSQSGRIVANTLTDNGFDTAGRLVSAVIPRHTLTYAYASSGGCGVNAGAGRNGNRTGFADTFDAGTPMTVAYCYDNAGRLTSTTVANPPSGVGPVAGGSLNVVGPVPTLGYDSHGNTTRLGDQTISYDVADRQMTGPRSSMCGGLVVTLCRGHRRRGR